MPEKTGGCVIMSDSFSLNVYKDSLKKFLETDSTGRPRMAAALLCRLPSVCYSGGADAAFFLVGLLSLLYSGLQSARLIKTN